MSTSVLCNYPLENNDYCSQDEAKKIKSAHEKNSAQTYRNKMKTNV